jgi:hypothetical protein
MDYDYKFFIEDDTNPFILFMSDKKIAYLNTAAEYLLGRVKKEKLYELALMHAPKVYGTKITHVDLKYDDLGYYAIMVGYKDDEYIGIRLYQKVKKRVMSAKELGKYTQTDINMLMETWISMIKLNHTFDIQLVTDMDIPEFKISQNDFFTIMRKSFESFQEGDILKMTLKMRVGESIYVQTKRLQLVKLEIESQQPRDESNDLDIEKICEEHYIDFLSDENRIRFLIPMLN